MRPIRVLLLTTSVLAACTTSDRGATDGANGGTIVIAMPEPSNVLPPYIGSAQDKMFVDLIYDRLADMDTTLATIGDRGFHPHLAASWDWAPDSLSIAFHVDPRARWHDGKPVTAQDVKFSFDVSHDPKITPELAPNLANIDSVTVRDSLTAVAWFRQRRPEQFYELVYNTYIMPEHVLGAVPPAQLRTTDLARKAIGSNRFRLSRWEPGTRVELIADTSNFRGRAKLDRVVLMPIADFDAGVTRLLTGQADFFEFLLPQHVARVDSSPDHKVIPYPGLGYAFLGMNQRDPANPSRPHPVFGDVGLRRALAMAVDRRGMLQNVFGKYGQISYGPFPLSLAVADTTLRQPGFDTGHAAALLDSAGWRRGADGVRVKNGRPLEFTVLVPTSSKARMSYAVLLQEQLRNVGAKMNIEPLDINVFVQRQDAKKFDAVMSAYSTDPSPSGSRQNWHTEGMRPGGRNALSYSNPRFDALIDSSLASSDFAQMKRYASQAYQVLMNDVPAIWLYDVNSMAGAHKRIHTVGMRADGWWINLADWTIPPGERIDRDRIGLTATED
jgi:peptide/nickel transport system substrate-binding protein